MSKNVFKEGDVVNTFLSRYHVVKKNNELIAVTTSYFDYKEISIDYLLTTNYIILGNSNDNPWLLFLDIEIIQRLLIKDFDF